MIYITEFGEIPLQFPTDRGRGSWAKGWDAGPHLKVPYWSRDLFFKWVAFSIPVPKLNMTLYAYITHITQSNNA